MNLTRCSNGHFYDADKFDTCPHCSKGAGQSNDAISTVAAQNANAMTVGKAVNIPDTLAGSNAQTQAAQSVAQATNQKPEAKDLKLAVDDVQKTVGKFNVNKGKGKEPVVGWLVCVEGPHKGEDFRLRMGKNFVGRAQSMDVVLANDSSVSREKHTIIVYEPKGNLFIIQAGESKELSYLNDAVVLSPQALKPYDTITLGNSSLLFVPFCTNDITWDNYSNDEE